MIKLPFYLQQAVKDLTSFATLKTQREEARQLSQLYRSPRGKNNKITLSFEKKQVYLATRLPATYAVIWGILDKLRQMAADFKPISLLDIGAGPGTATWAAVDIFSSLCNLMLLEEDKEWQPIAETLAKPIVNNNQSIKWFHQDLKRDQSFPNADIVIVSYALNELPLEKASKVIDQLWKAARQVLVIVEPGSRQGFETIKSVRANLIKLGAILVAPCPHRDDCPLSDEDWCHFPQKLPRMEGHRQAKNAQLNYEVEKFSYLVAVKSTSLIREDTDARVIKAPIRRSGHVTLDLCTPQGHLNRVTISRRNGEEYQKAKNVNWGDKWPYKK